MDAITEAKLPLLATIAALGAIQQSCATHTAISQHSQIICWQSWFQQAVNTAVVSLRQAGVKCCIIVLPYFFKFWVII
jgi:hypothetical protein